MTSRRLFLWQAINSQGEIVPGESLAERKEQVYQLLIEQNLQPYQVARGKPVGRRQWRGEALILFTRQLATLLQAGLPLMNALQLLAQQHQSAPWRCLLQEIGERVAQGQPLSEVTAGYHYVFPPIYRQLITLGELTGNLDRCCQQLAQQQEEQQKLRKKVLKAIRYPLFICAVAILVSLLMLLMVLPEFAKVYQSFDAPLPWFTQGLMNLSALLVSAGPYVLLAGALLAGGYWRYCHPHSRWRRREQRLCLRLPLIAQLIKGACLSQIFRTLHMTQRAGLTLLEGLDAALLSMENLFFHQALENIRQRLNQGLPLYQALAEQPLFPPLCQQLARVGEESGTLDTLLGKLALWHEQQTHELADALAQTLEPLLMLTIGIIVGGLVIAMYLPIFQLGTVLG